MRVPIKDFARRTCTPFSMASYQARSSEERKGSTTMFTLRAGSSMMGCPSNLVDFRRRIVTACSRGVR